MDELNSLSLKFSVKSALLADSEHLLKLADLDIIVSSQVYAGWEVGFRNFGGFWGSSNGAAAGAGRRIF